MFDSAISRRVLTGLLALAFVVTACERTTSTEPQLNHHQHAITTAAAAATAPVGGAGGALLKEVHAIASKFHSTAQAEKAGYAADPFCVESPAGGMGHHWVNDGLVDPVFDATQPEVALYAPDKNGTLKLVAVEYIVVNTGQARPAFDGHLFDIGGTPVPVPHWSLHVWLAKPNPNGLFAPWNPDVDCP